MKYKNRSWKTTFLSSSVAFSTFFAIKATCLRLLIFHASKAIFKQNTTLNNRSGTVNALPEKSSRWFMAFVALCCFLRRASSVIINVVWDWTFFFVYCQRFFFFCPMWNKEMKTFLHRNSRFASSDRCRRKISSLCTFMVMNRSINQRYPHNYCNNQTGETWQQRRAVFYQLFLAWDMVLISSFVRTIRLWKFKLPCLALIAITINEHISEPCWFVAFRSKILGIRADFFH